MSRTRISNAKGDEAWRDDGPSAARMPQRTFSTVPAAGISDMRPIIVGTVLSMSRVAVDDSHAKADAALRQKAH